MDDPVVGGYAPDKVALRRAISLGYNTEEEIRLVRRGAMKVAQSQVPPLTFGYDDEFISEMGSFDRARARALLDTYGYVDRDGDGWREQPDGSPLLLVMATQSSQIDRAFNEMWKRQLDALGIKVEFSVNQWPENNKSARSGKLMMWGLGWSARRLRSRLLPGPGAQWRHWRHQLRPLQACRVRRTLQPAAPAARRSEAGRNHSRNEAAVRRLHAVQGARPPLHQRPDRIRG